MTGRGIKILVVGIPNVGKSSFINRLAKGGVAKVADRPGVTRGNQWFSLGNGHQMLDTPGVLWPKFDDPVTGERLAFTGAVKDSILDVESLCVRLLSILSLEYPEFLKSRYAATESDDSWVMLEKIGRSRGMLISGGEIDLERASVMILDEFRSGKIGRITLEKAN